MTLILTIAAGALAGAAAGSLLVWWLLGRTGSADNQADSPDEWVSAEIDQAAATWATDHGCPEAAPLVADKLRLLHQLGARRRPAP